jgi:hypothetical protein
MRCLLGCTTSTERTDQDLGNDGTDLARGGGDTVAGRPVSRREAFAWHDESGRIWTAEKSVHLS